MPNETQLEFQSRRGGQSQCDKILDVLAGFRGEWVSVLRLHQASGSMVVHSRISDLRKKGHQIEHKNEWVEGTCHSFYQLL